METGKHKKTSKHKVQLEAVIQGNYNKSILPHIMASVTEGLHFLPLHFAIMYKSRS